METCDIEQITQRLLDLTSEETIAKCSFSEYSKEVDEASTACTQDLMQYLTAKANNNKKLVHKGTAKSAKPKRSRPKPRPLAPLRQHAAKTQRSRAHRKPLKADKHPIHGSVQTREQQQAQRGGTLAKKNLRSNLGRRQVKTQKPSVPSLRHAQPKRGSFAPSPKANKQRGNRHESKESAKVEPSPSANRSSTNTDVTAAAVAVATVATDDDELKSEGYSTDNYEDDFDESMDEVSGGGHHLEGPASTDELGVEAVGNSVEGTHSEEQKVDINVPVTEVATAEPSSIPLTEEDKALMRGNWEPIAMDKPDAIAGDSYNPQETPTMAPSSDEDSASYASEDFEVTDNYSPLRSPPIQEDEAVSPINTEGREQDITSPVPFLPEITPHSSHDETTKLSINDNTVDRTVLRERTTASESSTSTGEFESLLQEFEGVSYGGNPTQVAAS